MINKVYIFNLLIAFICFGVASLQYYNDNIAFCLLDFAIGLINFIVGIIGANNTKNN